MTPFHAPALAAIHEAAFPPGERWSAVAFEQLLQTPGAQAWLDERGGFVLLRQAGGEAEILTIAVAPAMQRQGLGRALLERAVAACDGPVFLEVARDNTAAVALYQSCGFVECGRRLNYYGAGRHALVLSRSSPSPSGRGPG